MKPNYKKLIWGAATPLSCSSIRCPESCIVRLDRTEEPYQGIPCALYCMCLSSSAVQWCTISHVRPHAPLVLKQGYTVCQYFASIVLQINSGGFEERGQACSCPRRTCTAAQSAKRGWTDPMAGAIA